MKFKECRSRKYKYRINPTRTIGRLRLQTINFKPISIRKFLERICIKQTNRLGTALANNDIEYIRNYWKYRTSYIVLLGYNPTLINEARIYSKTIKKLAKNCRNNNKIRKFIK